MLGFLGEKRERNKQRVVRQESVNPVWMQQTVSFLILVHIQVSIFAISDVYNASRKLLCTFCNGKTKWYIPSLKRNYLWYSSIDVILTRFYFTHFYSAIHVLPTFFFVWVLDDDKEFASENSRINFKCGMNKKIQWKKLQF